RPDSRWQSHVYHDELRPSRDRWRTRRGVFERTPPPSRKSRAPVGLTQRSGHGSLARSDFPRHKVVQRLSCLSDRKRQHNCIVGKTEPDDPIRDEIERIQDINDGGHDHHKILHRYIAVIAAIIRANQTQHRLEVGPKILERVFWYRGSLFYCFLEELTQSLRVFGI